ncbi:hypothetical protein PPYR_13427 [Photinus pyralis]|uniref:Reverse transcriptase domain-containing protein n=1 Tax=Photinus pyralis TaxID=7054 RepID=A0A5N4A921_PHOPY|nr:hypothetical protein PPYR_13427 [Photinus pyralis]
MTELTQFIATLQQLLEKVSNPTPHPETPRQEDKEDASKIHFDNFNGKIESFTTYIQRLENLFDLHRIQATPDGNALRAKVLLNCIGTQYYQLLCSLCSPDLPTSKTYIEIVDVLTKHLCPRQNIDVAQFNFMKRSQTASETISEYLASLKQLSIPCQFNCIHDSCKRSVSALFLRPVFICGLRDSNIRERLLIEQKQSFDELVELAITLEASKRNNENLAASCSSTLPTGAIQSAVQVNEVKSHKKIHRNRSRNRNSDHVRNSSNSQSRCNSQTRNKFSYLGIGHLCLRCALANHSSRECRISQDKLHCNSCNKSGHVAKVCISTLFKNRKNRNASVQYLDDPMPSSSSSSNYVLQVVTIPNILNTSVNYTDRKFQIAVQLENKESNFEIDSGSPVTFMSKSNYDKLKLSAVIQSADIQFRSFTLQPFTPYGKAEISVQYRDIGATLPLYIINRNVTSILGRDWMKTLGLSITHTNPSDRTPQEPYAVQQVQSPNSNCAEEIFSTFADLFKPEIGCIPGIKCSLRIRENTKPMFLKNRTVPYALLDKVNKELDKLESQQIITKTTHSEWGSPLVIVPKSNNEVRLCVDFKATVNPNLHEARYPIPLIEDIFNRLRGGVYYCTLDVHKAYYHIKMDEESSKIQAISTHRGVYLMNRLAFGIKVAPNEFQRIMDETFSHIPGTAVYFDDIIITGSTIEECRQRLITCLHKLRSMNLHLNRDKCKLFQTEVTYLGHTIGKFGIKKTKDKVQAIVDAPRPINSEQVHSFIGLTMYYAKFLPDISTSTAPLRELLKKNVKFVWTNKCEKAFNDIKTLISSDRVLVPYDPSLPLVLTRVRSVFRVFYLM